MGAAKREGDEGPGYGKVAVAARSLRGALPPAPNHSREGKQTKAPEPYRTARD